MLLRLHEWIDGGILKQRGQMQRHSSRLLCHRQLITIPASRSLSR